MQPLIDDLKVAFEEGVDMPYSLTSEEHNLKPGPFKCHLVLAGTIGDTPAQVRFLVSHSCQFIF